MVKGHRVGLCTGKDCRRADGFRTVEREVRRAVDVVELPCLDVCDGPVVVLEVGRDAPVVIERVRNRALALELIDHVTEGTELSGRLRKRILSGPKRAKARRRISRAL
jgi:RecB family endonuclease NucS